MKCPNCGHEENRVIDSRPLIKENGIRRRRECEKCAYRFTTYEYVTLTNALVVKSNGAREEFNREKLIHSIMLACVKRPVPMDLIHGIVKDVENKILNEGLSEIQSKAIGEMVIDALKRIDKVAYIRFASVYHDFESVDEFHRRIEDLERSENTL
ncbi:MAG: transcriptional regulator NrdR [Candidatus Marinimicrobia bacterium]|jgi:transcriptional repressor NrdR|nr:transcriptional regulator NrdR [Candidatus Neomarinimicrobiota bacterium]MDD4961816.1 transcriptional regulator NrdR [Candidatus Neomarinimicrobiota bacterium]MDD5709515.1 transcriptional regulator NrdR [Candidatus Neomarinimicrobiota bacterium]MDX9777807.1 transcriptional regulator NrdR [bacterium]